MAEIYQIFSVVFWKVDDFINTFWHYLTFSWSCWLLDKKLSQCEEQFLFLISFQWYGILYGLTQLNPLQRWCFLSVRFFVQPWNWQYVVHSRSKQRTDQRVVVLTLKFLALKKTGFPPVKNTSQICFDFYLPLFYATFECGPYNTFKKNLN